MRRIARVLLLVFVFTIPWAYSADLGPPLGNIARITGLILLMAFIPGVLQAGRFRAFGAQQWLVLALYLWFCCSYFWTVDQQATLERIRAYAQVMMIVWLAWELLDGPGDLRDLMRAYVAGAWVLAALTVADLAAVVGAGQVRFAAEGQDPNDVAHLLDIALPMATLLLHSERRWWGKALALGYLPLGLFGVMLTASRSGLLAASVAIAGCSLLLIRFRTRILLVASLVVPLTAGFIRLVLPNATIARLATIPVQLASGDLNQRLNIWAWGWRAFKHAPILGSGAGSFVAAAGTARIDTAHNTALSIAVDGGLVALALALAIVVTTVRSLQPTQGPLRIVLSTALLVWAVISLVATVEGNRSTWFLLALIAVAGRLAGETPNDISLEFDACASRGWPAATAEAAR